MLDDVLLQIQTDDPDIQPVENLQIIIQREGQVRLAAAEVEDRHFPILRKLLPDVLDKFQETVDLPEFVIFGMDDFSLGGS